jgi:crotonobetainyl-CoA:carnitine CoA-transferase CaiB-like acyl-CoA transferase
LNDPAVLASGLIGEHESETFGSYRYVAEPITLTASPLQQSRPSPALGEHTREVLAELGYDASQIDRLIAAGVIFAKQ